MEIIFVILKHHQNTISRGSFLIVCNLVIFNSEYKINDIKNEL